MSGQVSFRADFHGGNAGSNPAGDATSFQPLIRNGQISDRPKKAQFEATRDVPGLQKRTFPRVMRGFSQAQKGTAREKVLPGLELAGVDKAERSVARGACLSSNLRMLLWLNRLAI